MADAVRSLVLLALAAAGLTSLAALAGWWFEASRRLRRGLKGVLKTVPEAEAVDAAQGRAAGLDFEGRSLAVLWDGGGSGLVYAFHEIEGAELIIDGQVAARVRRGESRKALDSISRSAEQVTLRLMFIDARFPEFELDLWGPRSVIRRPDQNPVEAVRSGRRWLAHIDAVLRRTEPPGARASAEATPPPPAPRPAPASRDPDEDETSSRSYRWIEALRALTGRDRARPG